VVIAIACAWDKDTNSGETFSIRGKIRRPDMDQLGLVLRLTRIQQRIKQVELARIMEISPSTLSAIENGRRRPTQLQAYKINNALGKQIFNEDQD